MDEKRYRVFLALPSPLGLSEKMKAFQRGKEKPPLRWVIYEKIHLTLVFWPALTITEFKLLGEIVEKKLFKKNLSNNISSIISGFAYFYRAQVLYLKETSEQVFSIQKIIENQLGDLPKEFIFRKTESFIPHWTIARKFKISMLNKYEKYFQALDKFTYISETKAPVLYLSKDGSYIPFS
ncbi:MAG: hypothetical protein OEZ13_08825 [Spirochaetia bacterium]|nr:hypothetical protein [Spirochaetia bacterium]